MTETNWAGNYTYRATRVHRPASLEEAREIVAAAPRLRVLGSRHSFNAIGDADELLSLDGLPADVVVDHEAGTVTLSAWLKYGELAEALNREGVALHTLASLPHISVAGAVATATHGSGDAVGNLATAVAGLELITSDGELVTARRGDADFEGLVVGLGALGAVTRMTLDVQPDYHVRQRVYEGLSWDALLEHYDEITAAGDSVSVFSRWGGATEQVWVKSRVTGAAEEIRSDLFGAPAATEARHPILGMDPVNATAQLGEPGPWSDRLSHFRMGFMPSAGEEIQSEYLLPRRHALEAIEALRGLSSVMAPIIQVCELRTMAADTLWMSPQHGHDTMGIHFTWVKDQAAVERVLVDVEAALAPFGARPHWGKVFLAEADTIAPLYPRAGDFADLVARLDPRGAFRNEWLDRSLLGPR